MTHIALDITPALRQQAGIGRYTRELVRALVSRANHRYTLLVADRVSDAELYAQLPEDILSPQGSPPPTLAVTGIPARLHARWWGHWHLPPAAEHWTGPIDLFHAPDYLAPPLDTTPAVITIHDLSFLVHPDRAAPKLARHLTTTVPRTARRAAHILCDSANTRHDVKTHLDISPSRTSVAYPGIGPAFRPVTNQTTLATVSERYALTTPFVLGTGTLEPRKDWPTLIAAFKRSTLAARGYTLAIAGGEGWLTAPIHAAATAAGPAVRLLGFVPDADLPALYTLADTFAYPSRYEGFGLPPLEAMACGTPTVVSTAPCLPEVVGDAALKIAPGDPAALATALERLTTDDALRTRLTEAGPARAARFNWNRCAAAVEAAYAQVLDRRAP